MPSAETPAGSAGVQSSPPAADAIAAPPTGYAQTDTEFIHFCYHKLLRRAPDAEGLNIWQVNLAAGLPRESLLESFLGSPEYQALFSSEPYPVGHFYSALPSRADVARFRRPTEVRELPGIRLRAAEQLALLERFRQYLPELPFTPQPGAGRYHFENPSYSYGDAVTLYCFLRHFQPARIIEVGSGFSSCAMLDVNDAFFGGRIALTFVEPYPELLFSRMRPADRERWPVHAVGLQDVDLDLFSTLRANDILFIDSTHVSKLGSDVNRLFFELLPRLQPGVLVHIHDIFWPFEYPEGWLAEGRAWNEAYLLRAFLEFNEEFAIVWFQDYLARHHAEAFARAFPMSLPNTGANLWLRRSPPDRPGKIA